MKKYFLIFVFMTSCTLNQNLDKNFIPDIKFSDDLTLEQFKSKLKVYSKNKSYPNIDD
tara:strand:- start:340 stop:513 length:174 start_codon:yes stop_codon:yes gene_type:complete